MNTAAVKRKHGNAHRKVKTLKATKSKTVKVDGKSAQKGNRRNGIICCVSELLNAKASVIPQEKGVI